MLQMVEIEFIRKKHFVDGWAIRRLSRQLGVARQTVRKALASAEPPRYHLSQPRPCPTMDPYRAVIERWLVDDAQAPPKQRHTAQRIYDRLVAEHAFAGGESTVRRYVARLRTAQGLGLGEVMIPLTAAWGQQAQVDWGQAVVELAGEPIVVHLFCLRLRASGVAFAWAAPTEKLEAFLEGHVHAFAWLGGVPAECVYDNPKTAVVRILAGPVREEHTRFSSLRAHYLFESQFCRPGQAHEKGAVEHLVGYVRRNALVPVPRFAGWAELNAHLLAWCEGEREQRAAAWAQEQARLRPLPAPPFVPALTRLVPVSRLSLIRFDHNRYSVPGRYVGRTLRLAAFTDRLELWDGEVPVATHRRQYQRGQTQLELAHYLPALARKPRAVSHAAVVAQLPPIYATVRDDLCRQDPEGYRRFAALLLLHQEFPAEVVTTALEHAWQQHCLDVAVVRQLALNQVAPPRPAPVPVPAVLDQLRLAPLDLSQYDRLPAEVTR